MRDDSILSRELDFIAVKGKEKPEKIFEVFHANEESIKEKKQQSLKFHNQGMAHYFSREWEASIESFKESLKLYSNDIVAQMYIDRCMKYRNDPPPDDWVGVTRMTTK